MNEKKKDEIEKISPRSVYNISFICSFGYKVVGFTRRKNRLNDIYTLWNLNTGATVQLLRREFFDFAQGKFGGLKKVNKLPVFNPMSLDYIMF